MSSSEDSALTHDDERKEIRTSIKRLVSKLIDNANADITNELKNIIYCCQHAQFIDNLRFAIEKLRQCEHVITDKNKFSNSVHLSVLLALTTLEIELSLKEIDALEEQLRSCRNRFAREGLSTRIEFKKLELNERRKELQLYLDELEGLQQNGM